MRKIKARFASYATLLLIVLTVTGLAFAGPYKSKSDDKLGEHYQEVEIETFRVTLENVSPGYEFTSSGVFNTPLWTDGPGPLLPGQVFQFSFPAEQGEKLSFATMFGVSNDFFYAPSSKGIPLFDENGIPLEGDITNLIYLWDAGTEINEEPGLGAHQPQRASGGPADTKNFVRPAEDTFHNLPMVDEVLRVTIINQKDYLFTVRIENVSTSDTLMTSDGQTQPVPLSPGVWVIHRNEAPLFESGETDRGQGLEHIAESGNPTMLASHVKTLTGVPIALSPGVAAIHDAPNPIFGNGSLFSRKGLEQLAEQGNPMILATSLTYASDVKYIDVFSIPTGEKNPGPITPGNSYTFKVRSTFKDRLSVATMFGTSNDLFYAPAGGGISLFDAEGNPISEDVTNQFILWDAGTEVNEHPYFGPNQPSRGGATTGIDEGSYVRPVNDGFNYPNIKNVLRVTVSHD